MAGVSPDRTDPPGMDKVLALVAFHTEHGAMPSAYGVHRHERALAAFRRVMKSRPAQDRLRTELDRLLPGWEKPQPQGRRDRDRRLSRAVQHFRAQHDGADPRIDSSDQAERTMALWLRNQAEDRKGRWDRPASSSSTTSPEPRA